ncbi:MAG TPA: hypothetical protein VGB00_17325, partial [Pyrinomonadaceae bacterium]
DFNDAIKINPNDPDYYANRARAFAALEKWKETLRDLSMAIEVRKKNGDLTKDDAYLYEWRASTLQQLGKFKEAENDIKRMKSLIAKGNK